MSFIRFFGPSPNAAVAMDGSVHANHKILKIKEFNNFDVAVGRFLMWQLAVLK